jgi:hypothetical protein
MSFFACCFAPQKQIDPNANQPKEIKLAVPQLGVTVSFLESFITENGGSEAFEGLSTEDVWKKFIKEKTAAAKTSLCELLIKENTVGVRKADVLLTHSWSFCFLDVVKLLKATLSEQPNASIWFDIFSFTQHNVANVDYDFWLNSLKSLFPKLVQFIFLLPAWSEMPLPALASSTWSCYEIYQGISAGKNVHFAISRSEKKNLIRDLIVDTSTKLGNILNQVDFSKTNFRDKEMSVRLKQSATTLNAAAATTAAPTSDEDANKVQKAITLWLKEEFARLIQIELEETEDKPFPPEEELQNGNEDDNDIFFTSQSLDRMTSLDLATIVEDTEDDEHDEIARRKGSAELSLLVEASATSTFDLPISSEIDSYNFSEKGINARVEEKIESVTEDTATPAVGGYMVPMTGTELATVDGSENISAIVDPVVQDDAMVVVDVDRTVEVIAEEVINEIVNESESEIVDNATVEAGHNAGVVSVEAIAEPDAVVEHAVVVEREGAKQLSVEQLKSDQQIVRETIEAKEENTATGASADVKSVEDEVVLVSQEVASVFLQKVEVPQVELSENGSSEETVLASSVAVADEMKLPESPVEAESSEPDSVSRDETIAAIVQELVDGLQHTSESAAEEVVEAVMERVEDAIRDVSDIDVQVFEPAALESTEPAQQEPPTELELSEEDKLRIAAEAERDAKRLHLIEEEEIARKLAEEEEEARRLAEEEEAARKLAEEEARRLAEEEERQRLAEEERLRLEAEEKARLLEEERRLRDAEILRQLAEEVAMGKEEAARQQSEAEGFTVIDVLEEILAEFVQDIAEDVGQERFDKNQLRIALAEILRSLTRYDKAEELLQDALQDRLRRCGRVHPDTLTVLHLLGALWDEQSHYDKAEPYFTEAFKKRKAVLGPKHDDTVTSMYALAVVYRNTKKFDKALPLYEKCYKVRREKLGDDHQQTLSTQYNLALMYQNQKQYRLATPLYSDCLQRRKVTLGETHPQTLMCMYNLAVNYFSQGKFELAEQYYLENLDKRRKTLGADHVDTLNTMNNLAALYHQVGQEPSAALYYTECLKRRTQTLGPDHASTVRTKNNLEKLRLSHPQLVEEAIKKLDEQDKPAEEETKENEHDENISGNAGERAVAVSNVTPETVAVKASSPNKG